MIRERESQMMFKVGVEKQNKVRWADTDRLITSTYKTTENKTGQKTE